jgi:hypothetical protein
MLAGVTLLASFSAIVPKPFLSILATFLDFVTFISLNVFAA